MPAIAPISRVSRWVWMSVAGSLLLCSLDIPPCKSAEPKAASRRFVPADALVGYVEFDGLDAHADAWKATAAHGLLVETTAGTMMTEIARQLVDRLLKMVPTAGLAGDDLMALQDHLVHRGFVLALRSDPEGTVTLTVVLNGVGRKEIRERFERVLRLMVAPGEGGKLPVPARLRGRDIYQITASDRGNDDQIPALQVIPGNLPLAQAPPGKEPESPRVPWLSWWFEQDDLILIAEPTPGPAEAPDPAKPKAIASGPRGQSARVLDVIEGKRPNVTTHLGYLAALVEGKDIKGFEADGLFFIDPGKDKGLLTSFLGLDDVSRDASRRIGGLLVPGASPSSSPSLPALPALVPDVKVIADDPGVSPPAPTPEAATPKPEDAPPAKVERAQIPDEIRKLGLDGMKRIVGRWGFQGKALLTDIRIEAPGPRKGLVALLDQPGFRKDRLPPIPRDAGAFAVSSLDLLATYQKLIDSLKVLEPEVGGQIGQVEEAIRAATGLKLREDLLSHLGPTWSVFPVSSVDRGRDDRDKVDPTAFVLLAGVKDAEAFGKVLDSIATRVNATLREAEKEPGPAMLLLERLPAPNRGYRLTSPARLVFWLNDELQPTILVGKSYVAFASNLARAREALAAERQGGGGWRPTGELINAFEGLPDQLTFLSVGDPRDSAVPDGVADLPRMVQSLSTILGDVTDFDTPSTANFLAAIGVPRPGGFRLRIDPSTIPKPEALRSYLFPSVMAASVDDRGLRLVIREAFPFACTGNMASVKSSMKWSGTKGLERDVKLKFGLGN